MNKKMLIFLSISSALYAIDNAHWYRATNLFQEARLANKLLSSVDVTVSAGSTEHARNKHARTVPLFDIYGINNMHDLGVGVPDQDPTNIYDLILLQLAQTPGRTQTTESCACPLQSIFAHFSIAGECDLVETNVTYIQNAVHGFFAQLHVPIRRIKIGDICFKDISPTDNSFGTSSDPAWVAFKNNFDGILSRHRLSKASFNHTGIGDISVLAGWTHSYDNTKTIDFIDTTLMIGLLLPTGATKNEDVLFSIATGYNGHLGIPVVADIAIGAYEWLTFGIHLDGTIFTTKKRDIRLKTSAKQSGFIKLAKGTAEIEKGFLWTGGTCIKADHFYRGFSATFGYSYTNKRRDMLTACDSRFDPLIINTDETYAGFAMHTLHTHLEYDFMTQNSLAGVRIALFYNKNIHSTHTFKTDIIGGSMGIDISWQF